MKFKLLKNEHGAVITHVALALSGIEREDAAQLIVSPQMALILKDKMSVKEIMTAISSMVMVVGNLAHRLVEMCEPQCEDCDYDCISELLNSAVDSVCMDIAKQYNSVNEQNDAYESATSVINGFVDDHGCLKELLKQYIEEDTCGK
ncbi:MAG: hypothetical protein DBX49_07470 [Clostridia bacterium]|nr:MAG: hypothetical protein DBX49_07470 [Clostridia bacterium]